MSGPTSFRALAFPLLLTSLLSVFVVASGCPTVVGKVGCENPRDCAPGNICTDGQCVPGAGGCTLDADCNAVTFFQAERPGPSS